MLKKPYTAGWIATGIFLAIFSGILWIGQVQLAQADGHGRVYDGRYGHNHYYPARGVYVNAVPGGYRVLPYGGINYYYAGGVWYRPYGGRFVIVGPPIGVFVPFLPPYYATVMVGGVPYYYANDVYYAQAPGGYVVVNPPAGAVVVGPPPPPVAVTAPPPPPPPVAEKMFIYPRQGQTEQQKSSDQYACHRWAVGQTGYDPTLPPGGGPDPRRNVEYQRAVGACLDARGYTVK